MQFDRLKRREFMSLLGGTATWPLGARAQQSERMRRIGVLMLFAEDDPREMNLPAFRDELRKMGWVEGLTLRIDYRWGSDRDKIRTLSKELVESNPDVILCQSSQTVSAVLEATRTIPTIFVETSDPAFVENLARPSGNATGFTNFESSMGGKWLEMLKEIAPRTRQITAIYNPTTSPHIAAGRYLLPIEDTARRLVIKMTNSPVRSSTEVEQAIARVADAGDGGLVVLPDIFTTDQINLIISQTAKYRLPAIYPFDFMTRSGGLVSYGIDTREQFLGAAAYVDRLLRGAKIADLPVQAPTRFHLVVNLKTAKALGIDIPPTVLTRADEVIE